MKKKSGSGLSGRKDSLKNDSDQNMYYYGDSAAESDKGEDERTSPGRKGPGSFWGGVFMGILMSLLVITGAAAGRQVYLFFQARQTNAAAGKEERESSIDAQTIRKLEAIEEVIDQYYYKTDVEEKQKQDGMYKGLVAALGDPYSIYYTEEELKDTIDQTKGIYYGIGAYIQLDKELLLGRIKEVIEGSPAEAAGLKANDVIYQVDGETVQGLDLTELVSRIKGKEGTTVHLTIYREGENDYLEFDVKRKKLDSVTVDYEMLDDAMGYLRIREFDDVTLDQFTEAMAVLRGSGMKGLVLDLRGNPGGNLSTVTDIARQILPKGLIVYTEDREGKRTEYSSDGAHQLELPLVVLVDAYSASASEILAGAIKDYGIGTLVGTTTFGKGIVQKILSMSDGTAIKLTVSSYFTPKGNNIHGLGIEPDVECKFEAEPYAESGYDNQLEKAKEVLAGLID